jgi:5'-methylthioadenosine phosphorylase
LASAAADAAQAAGSRVHRGGTYICIEGPQFSTKAESLLYRSWGVSVIGMTAMPEAKLARVAQLPYATIAYVTDYDCWHETQQPVSVQAVIAVLKDNAAKAQETIRQLLTRLPDPRKSVAATALDHAVITPSNNTDPEVRARLTWLLG